MNPGPPSGGGSIGMPNRRLFGRAGRRDPELDWSSIAATLALRLDGDFPPDFHASAGGPEIVVTHGDSVWRVMLSDVGAAPSKEELTLTIGQALDGVRDFVAREVGHAWSPVLFGSKPRVDVTPSSLSVRYEQLGRPTALLGPAIPLSWRAPTRRSPARRSPASGAPNPRTRATPGGDPTESKRSASDPR